MRRIPIVMPNGKVIYSFAEPVKETAAVNNPVERAVAPEVAEAEPKHVGGGWYELSDGRRVRKSEL